MLETEREQIIIETHNKCIKIIEESNLTSKEIIITLAQMLIYIGESITEKKIDILSMDIQELWREYYGNNKDNDIGLGLILNGTQLMGALDNNNAT